MSELGLLVNRLDTACCPEDVFGSDLSSSFKKLARACHPDLNKDPLAEQAFQKLATIKEEADARVQRGEWGKRIPFARCIPLEIEGYKVKRNPYLGDIADIYRGIPDDFIIKVARSAHDNDLIDAEADALKAFNDIQEPIRQGVPVLKQTLTLGKPWGRHGNVLTRFPGFWTAQEIELVTPVDSRTAVWMFKRVLSVLSWVHHFNLIHGAILPPHVMFYPDNDGGGVDKRKHTVRLVDWCYSVNYKSRTKLSAWLPAWKDMYAPELLDKSYIGPESDIYMAAKLMLYLMQTTLFMPELQRVIIKCLERDPTKRYRNAKDALDAWTEAAIKAYGAPKWHDFNLPTTPSGR